MRPTKAERLLILRRRAGESQAQAAARLGISLGAYTRLERGVADHTQELNVEHLRLEPHERCLLLRRRGGHTQQEIADRLGCSRLWLNRMERGAVSGEALVEFWAFPA